MTAVSRPQDRFVRMKLICVKQQPVKPLQGCRTTAALHLTLSGAGGATDLKARLLKFCVKFLVHASS